MVVLVPPLPCTQLPSWVSFVPHACKLASWWARKWERMRLGIVVVQGHHIACPSCSAEYLTAEVLELAGNASKDLKVRESASWGAAAAAGLPLPLFCAGPFPFLPADIPLLPGCHRSSVSPPVTCSWPFVEMRSWTH